MSPMRQHRAKSSGPGGLVTLHRTNYATNPSFETDGGAGQPAGTSEQHTTAVLPTYSLPADGLCGTKCHRIQYTAQAGDSNALVYVNCPSAAGSFSAGDAATVSLSMKGASSGVAVGLRLQFFDVGNASLGNTDSSAVTLTGSWQRISVSGTCPANTSYVRATLLLTSITNGDSIDISVDGLLIEKAASALPYFDGSYPDCKWTGAAHASTSQRYRVQT